jgi:hypothetical protein
MSNIAGKAYAMNVITPLRSYTAWCNRFFFWLAGLLKNSTAGLQTLSLIHYARWVILTPKDFPRLGPDQPEETLKYSYMMFFSNFNGSWDQYVDSFSAAIPSGLDMFWKLNIKYPKSVPMLPFHQYITSNQIWTDHYYNAYPMATTNDVKSGKRVKDELRAFCGAVEGVSAKEFRERYNQLLLELQHDLSQMGPHPVISLSAQAVENRLQRQG